MEYVLLAVLIMSIMCFFVPVVVVLSDRQSNLKSVKIVWGALGYILLKKRYLNGRVPSKKIIGITEQERINSSGSVARIYFFDYTGKFGYYHLLAGCNTKLMMYNGVPISESIEETEKGPIEFFVSQFGTDIALRYINASLPRLCKISQNIAESFNKFIVMCYDDGKIRYFKYDENFCEVFEIIKDHKM